MARGSEEGRPLTPVAMVAEALASDVMSTAQAESALRRLLLRTMSEASEALANDPLSSVAMERVLEYLAVSELVTTFGTTLKAWEDIELYELRRVE